jgi:hypothetical protein
MLLLAYLVLGLSRLGPCRATRLVIVLTVAVLVVVRVKTGAL